MHSRQIRNAYMNHKEQEGNLSKKIVMAGRVSAESDVNTRSISACVKEKY